jgi:diguanylate cyclase
VTASTDFDRARFFASQALDAMAQRRIPPTPNNFSVWFAHLSGTYPELSRAIEILDSNKAEFTPERNAELYERLIGDNRQANELREAGERISAAVTSVLNLIERAGTDSKQYGEKLGAASQAMGGPVDPMKLKAVAEQILGETRRMIQHNDELNGRLAASSREMEVLRRQIDDARRESLIDPLTGVGNRKLFDVRLRECMRNALEDGNELCLLMADIDHFKKFNDTYGHQLGDLVLRLVAKTLTDGIKGRDSAARYGGEEFAILLPKTKLEDAVKLADGLRALIASRRVRKRGDDRDLGTVTLSMGASVFRPGEPAAEFVQRADAALYFAKRHGRNRVASEHELEASPVLSKAAAKI